MDVPRYSHVFEYFEVVKTYEKKGFLELRTETHEAYITRAALYALSNSDVRNHAESPKAVFDTARYIRMYAAWRSQNGQDYYLKPFAVNVVREDAPHDLLYTIFISLRRRWWWPFRKTVCFDIIKY